MSSEIARLKRLLRRTYEGPAWHGPAVKEVLGELAPGQAGVRIDDSYSPLDLVLHMTIWREFVIRHLKGETHPATDDELAFPRVDPPDEDDWPRALAGLERSQRELLKLLDQFPNEKLPRTVPGKDFNWNAMLHGIIHHDLYHLGQIQFLRKFGG